MPGSGLAITVVGAGVNGLCTAALLTRRGHRVRVIASAPPEETVSSVAGAVWFPFQVGAEDQARVRGWALATRQWMTELARVEPAAGVDLLTAYEITPGPADAGGAAREAAGDAASDAASGAGDARPWWAEGLEVERAPAPVAGAPLAWRFAAPRAEPALLLRHFAAQLAQPIELQRVASLDELPGDVVVNCTGLGARALVGDAALAGIFGQVVLAERGEVALDVSITDDRDPSSFFYVIPRRGELVLGGIARPEAGDAPPPAEPAISERILAHAARLGLRVGPVRQVRVGLRPYRPMVRVERDAASPRILHNYGHGGSGFTLCHGTAQAIAELVEG